MKTAIWATSLTILAASAPSVDAMGARAGHELRFAAAAGTSLTRDIAWTIETKTEATTTTVDGEPADGIPAVSFDSKRTVHVGVSDAIEGNADGRPNRFVRSYTDLLEELEANVVVDMMGQKASFEIGGEGTSELEGDEVRFTWSSEEEAWEAAWADPEVEHPSDELLAGLGADMDLLALLPAGEVEVGAEWDVELARIAGVLFPGGELAIELETDLASIEGALDPAHLPGIADVLRRGEAEGEARCKLVAVEDGVARVELTVKLTAAAAFVAEVDALAEDAKPEGVEVEVTDADFTVALEGKGELRFLVDAGHAESFTFEGEAKEESTLAAAVRADGEDLAFEQTQERSSTLAVTYAIE